MTYAPETLYVAVDDVEVAYQVIGDGPLDLLYHHGLCHLDMQRDVAREAAFNERLTALGRLILFDRRGSGASERAHRDHFASWEEWSEDLTAVLDAAGSERCAIFAEAEAGPTAILFAVAHPERVSALVLGNTAARIAVADDYPIGMSHAEIDEIVGHIEKVWGKNEFLAASFPSLIGDTDALSALARLTRAAATPRVAAGLYRHLFEQLDVREVLSLVQAPTLVLYNEASDGPRNRYLADHIEGARAVEVPGHDYLFFGGDHDLVIAEVAEFLTGRRPPVEVDRILTTVMFTDIVSSTERVVAIGDQRWRRLLDEHDRVIRNQLATFRGREINTTGDGFVACFDGPARATRCALAIAGASRELGLEVTVGLHTGECERRGDDLSGLAVHIASRVGTLANPGEVLVSRTVTDLVAGSGIEFADRGDHELKGVPGEWRLYAAIA